MKDVWAGLRWCWRLYWGIWLSRTREPFNPIPARWMTPQESLQCTYWVYENCPRSLEDAQWGDAVDRDLGTFQAALMLWQEQYGYHTQELNMRVPSLMLADKRERMLYKLTWG